jgi:carboxylesterase type B
MVSLKSKLGTINGIEKEYCNVYLGIPFAKASRFKYAEEISFLGDFNALKPGDACIQKRCYYAHLEVPERMFYHKEFREGIDFTYSEDCLNLNIYTPKEGEKHPVLVFIHGGGFDSGANYESAFDGEIYAKNGIITVFIQYRVGVFGYFCHEDIQKEFNHDGNFGLDDQIVALKWVKHNIKDFGGDPNNITIMGQSAGAMSIQVMLLSPKCKDLFQKAIMMSGGGKFPSMATPKVVEQRRDYWKEVMKECGCASLEEFRNIEPKKIFDALEVIKSKRKDNQISTMTMIDHYYLEKSEEELFKNKIEIPTIIGFTNNDMFTIVLALMARKYASKNNCYCYYFDVNAKGDNNLAFHSSDLRYAFNTLNKSWRPYDEDDNKLSLEMVSYFSYFIKTGNPNSSSLPLWEKSKHKVLRFKLNNTKMSRIHYLPLLKNTFKGDPK